MEYILILFLVWDLSGIAILLINDWRIIKDVSLKIPIHEIVCNILIWGVFLIVVGSLGPIWLYFIRKEEEKHK